MGPQGLPGAPGPKGNQGDPGEQGSAGPQGPSGSTTAWLRGGNGVGNQGGTTTPGVNNDFIRTTDAKELVIASNRIEGIRILTDGKVIIIGLQNHTSPDARLGIYYNSEKFYASLSANSLLGTALNKNNDVQGL